MDSDREKRKEIKDERGESEKERRVSDREKKKEMSER